MGKEDAKKEEKKAKNEARQAAKAETKKAAEDKTWQQHLEAAKKIINGIKAETKKKYNDPKVQIPGLRAKADMTFEELKESLVDKAHTHENVKKAMAELKQAN